MFTGPYNIWLIFIYIISNRVWYVLLPKPQENTSALGTLSVNFYFTHSAFALKHAMCEIPRHPDVIFKASFRHHFDIISHINSKTEIKGKPSVVTLVLRNYWLLRSIIDIKNAHPTRYNIIYIIYWLRTNNARYIYIILYIRFLQWTVNGVFLSFLWAKNK